ncbi:hypothetical protein OROMI_023370 [Orobanche minor]
MPTSKYYVTFGGATIDTTVTDRGATASTWVREVTALHGGSPAVVGLDVEWRPHHVSYMSNKSATLQLCIDKKSFLMNPNFTFVGVEVDQDVAKLRDEYGLGCARSMDIRAEFTARRSYLFWKPRPGLKDLARVVCGLLVRSRLSMHASMLSPLTRLPKNNFPELNFTNYCCNSVSFFFRILIVI